MRRKTKGYHKASKRERMYFFSGIPERYWASLQYKLAPIIVEDRDGITKVSVARQEKDVASLKKPLDRAAVIGIGSAPSDDAAMAVASDVAKELIARRLRVEYIDLGDWSIRYQVDNERLPDMVVIHNLMIDSPPQRLMHARDWAHWADGTLCMIVVAGTDPVTFFRDKLRMRLDIPLFSTTQPFTRRST